jgi:D-3-phosphoglycerate dehydrogenase
MYKVVVTDYGFSDLNVEREVLAPLGVNLEGAQCKTVEEVAAVVADADAVITQFAPVRALAIAAMGKARAIIRYGIGVDNVDLAAAASRKIPVCNVPDYCLDEVADHTLAFILALTRQVVPNALMVRSGQWKSAATLEQFHCLRNMTVGVVGFGRIGRAVIQRLATFGCRVLVSDPVVAPAIVMPTGAQLVSLDELLGESDLITLHCPSIAATRGMINKVSLARMKSGALFVNASRGDLVVTDDVVEALRSGRLAGAAFDVTNPEPLPADSPLSKFPQVIISSHVASVSPQAVRRLRETVAELAAIAIQGKPLKNIVNGV